MSKYLLPILGLILITGCEKHEDVSIKISDGIYDGTFQRELVWSESDTANITIIFSTNNWSGSSDVEKYPALCKGTYYIKGDTINFNNECNWTAEFDWSLILHGKYFITIKEAEIEFYKDYHSATSDTYIDRYKIIKRQK